MPLSTGAEWRRSSARDQGCWSLDRSRGWRASLRWWLSGLLALCLTGPARTQEISLTNLRIEGFKAIDWRPEDNYFRSPGPVKITLSGHGLDEAYIIDADDVEGSPGGDMRVRGHVVVRRPGVTVAGEGLRMNLQTEAGELANAEARASRARLRGRKLLMEEHGGLRAQGADFTTCSGLHPHYMIAARDLQLNEDGMVRARGVSLRLGGVTILSIPYLERSFSNKVTAPFPLPGYSRETGLRYRFDGVAASRRDMQLTYDLVASVRRSPHGNVTIERDIVPADPALPPPSTRARVLRDAGNSLLAQITTSFGDSAMRPNRRGTAFATAGFMESVYNRRVSNLRVSRLPEIGVTGALDFGDRSEDAAIGTWEISAGMFEEHPSHVRATRGGAQLSLVSATIRLRSALGVRFGLGLIGRAYDDGGAYGVIAPEVEGQWNLGNGNTLAAAFRHQNAYGSTPFLFDAVDVRNELRFRYNGDLARWSCAVQVAYDADRWRASDTALQVVHKLDCMEFGITYRTRSQGLGFILNLMPGSLPGGSATNTLTAARPQREATK